MAPGSAKTWMRAAAAALAVAACAGGAAGGEVELGPRHVDPRHGFSIRPPAGVEANVEFAVNRLARWLRRDEKTRAIAWTLAVRKETAPPEGVSVRQFAEQLAGDLRKQKDLHLESLETGRLLDKETLHLRSRQGTTSVRWQSELWVLADRERFLVLSINGPLGRKDYLEAVLREVAGTLKLSDPKALAAARRENLARGRKCLEALTEQRLLAAAPSEPLWYLYRRDDQEVGFFHLSAKPAVQAFHRGLEVRTFARLAARDGQVMYVRRVMFCTPDRRRESWTESVQVRRGGKVVQRMSEEGSAQGGQAVCRVTAGDKTTTRKKPLPPETAAHYLPRAVGPLLPRLVDLARPAAYAFAVYTTAHNDFDLRTFTVAEAERITLGAQSVPAIRASDQLAADQEPATLHLASDGSLLRLRTGDGLVMEQASRSAVLRRFPDADSMVNAR